MQVFITLGDIFSIAIGVIVALFLAFVWGATAWRQWRCKHTGSFGETQACDAICHDCGKNLGFIQAVRDSRKSESGKTGEPT